jgi:hypothetical protein
MNTRELISINQIQKTEYSPLDIEPLSPAIDELYDLCQNQVTYETE